MANEISHIKGPDNTSYDIKDATARSDISNLATVASTGEYSDLLHPPTVAEIDDHATVNNKTWSSSKISMMLHDPVTFKTKDIPEEAANLSTTATAHCITAYRNGLSIPYRADDTNDGGILRVRGTTESDCILELGTWDDSGAGETIQFNYYPTTSQVTPTYSVSVPKKSGTIALTTDVDAKLSKAGDTMSGLLKFTNTSRNIEVPARSISYVDGAKGNAGLYMPHTYNKDEWGPIFCVQNKAGGSWSVGSYNGEDLEFVNFTKTNIDSSTNTARCNWRLSPTNGFVGPWNGTTDDHGTNNTSDTWVPVYSNNKLQHRAIPTAYNNSPWSASSIVSLNGYSNTTVASTQFLAYWNGAYNSSGNSNLRYTAAGDLVTYEQSYTRNHASVSYTEHLRCWRSGKVVTLGGYFSCNGSIAANTLLYTLPAPKFVIYFTAKHETSNRMYNFNLQTNGQLKTNEAIAGGNYLVCFTYVCA